jgi:hypothetical protein
MADFSVAIRIKDLAFYIVVFLIAIVAWESQKYMYSTGEKIILQQSVAAGGVVGEVLSQCNGVQKQQIDAYLEVNRLLTTLGTTLLGAVFYLLSGGVEKFEWKCRRWAAITGMIFVAISIFFGYVAYSFMISVLQDGRCDVSTLYPHWAQQAHFYTFFLGVVFFADFTYCNLMRGHRNEKQHAH